MDAWKSLSLKPSIIPQKHSEWKQEATWSVIGSSSAVNSLSRKLVLQWTSWGKQKYVRIPSKDGAKIQNSWRKVWEGKVTQKTFQKL